MSIFSIKFRQKFFATQNDQDGFCPNMEIDIICFYYISGKKFSKQIAVDILLADDDFYLDNLPVRIVSDINVNVNESVEKTSFKRCGLRFEDLTSHQRSKLSCFIPKQDSGYIQDKRTISCGWLVKSQSNIYNSKI